MYTIYLVYILTALLIRNQITKRAQREEKRKELLRDSKESLQSYLQQLQDMNHRLNAERPLLTERVPITTTTLKEIQKQKHNIEQVHSLE